MNTFIIKIGSEMRIPVFITLLCSLNFSLGVSQSWVFEYDPEKKTYHEYGTMLDNRMGSYHSIYVAPGSASDKDTGRRLVHLDENGNVMSFFRPKDCDVHYNYFPLNLEKVITVGPDCTERGPYVINELDVTGKRVWNKQVQEGFSFMKIVQYKDDISFVQRSWYGESAEILITTLAKDLKSTDRKITIKSVSVPGHKSSISNIIQSDKDTYLIVAQIYDVDKNSVVTQLYSKLVLVRNGAILWINSLENTIIDIRYLVKVQKGFLIVGHDPNSVPLVIIFDANGNIINRFTPYCASRGVNTRYYFTGNSLMIIDQKARGLSMFISSYDLTGQLEWQQTIPIGYAVFRNASIMDSDGNSFMVNGLFSKEFAGPTYAFIMKFDFEDMVTDTFVNTKIVRKVFSEDIISKVDPAVNFVRVTPDPTHFELTFEMENANEQAEYLLGLFDVSGKEVLSRRNTTSKFSEDISYLPAAVYDYSILNFDGKQIISGQIIKK